MARRPRRVNSLLPGNLGCGVANSESVERARRSSAAWVGRLLLRHPPVREWFRVQSGTRKLFEAQESVFAHARRKQGSVDGAVQCRKCLRTRTSSTES